MANCHSTKEIFEKNENLTGSLTLEKKNSNKDSKAPGNVVNQKILIKFCEPLPPPLNQLCLS